MRSDLFCALFLLGSGRCSYVRKPWYFYIIIMEMTSHNFHILFDRRQSINPAHSEGEDIIQGCDYLEASVTEYHVKGHLLHSQFKLAKDSRFISYLWEDTAPNWEEGGTVRKVKIPYKRTCLFWQCEKWQFCKCFYFRIYQTQWDLGLFLLRSYHNFCHKS